jgi:hypothetical protein
VSPLERMALMALAALHREFGPDATFHADAVALVAGQPVVVELNDLRMRGWADLLKDSAGVFGYRLTGPGFDALPHSEEKRALAAHREETDQSLREEQ